MSEPIGPAVARDRLRARLRELRDSRGMSVPDVERAANWPASKVEGIETGEVPALPLEVETLLGIYGAGDTPEVDELIGLAAIGRSVRWWTRHRLTGEHQQFVALEGEASRISVYQPLVVPGLVQTRQYATAATAAILDKDPADPDVAARVEIRLERQHVLLNRAAAGDAPALVVILEESVLRRPVGGTEVLRAQLDHLLRRAEEPHLTMVVIPTRIGGHVGLGGVFELLEFADPRDPDVVFIESAACDFIIRGPDVTALYRANVERLRSAGMNGDSALATISDIRNSLPA
jgi:transcriptional regulator with XRE-family HTH domain